MGIHLLFNNQNHFGWYQVIVLYCLVTEAHRCEQLAQSCYAALPRVEIEPATY